MMHQLLRFLDIGSMIYVEHLGERVGEEVASVLDKSALEVSHTALSAFHAATERADGRCRKSVDTAGNKSAFMIGVSIKEASNSILGIGAHVERLLIIDEISHSHHAFRFAFGESLVKEVDVITKFLFAEDSIYRCHHERFVANERRKLEETVHRTWS